MYDNRYTKINNIINVRFLAAINLIFHITNRNIIL